MTFVAHSLAIRPPRSARTWTVIDADHRTVLPVEEWLEAHRHLWSPNTVRGYSTSLAQWWTFLEQRGEENAWHEVGVPAVTGFLAWLRNGRVLEHSLVASQDSPSSETLEARLAALISFYRWQGAVFGVAVAGRLMRGAPHRAQGRGLLAHLDARSAGAPSSLVRVRGRRRRERPPLLLPQQIQHILDGCAVVDSGSGEWSGNLRDRLLFALLAETPGVSQHFDGCPRPKRVVFVAVEQGPSAVARVRDPHVCRAAVRTLDSGHGDAVGGERFAGPDT